MEQCELKLWAEKVWKCYLIFAQSCAVSRKGYELVGLAPRTADGAAASIAEAIDERGESDLEHMAKVQWLALVIMANTDVSDRFFNYWNNMINGVLERSMVAIGHDVGETAHGDIPDDGRKEHDKRENLLVERSVFENMLRCLPDYYEESTLALFASFQEKDGNQDAQALKALDKLEAIWTLLACEKGGHRGSLAKKVRIGIATGSDEYAICMTGTDTAADCWTFSWLTRANGYMPPGVKKVIRALLEVAFMDVRGGLPAWWQKIDTCPSYEEVCKK